MLDPLRRYLNFVLAASAVFEALRFHGLFSKHLHAFDERLQNANYIQEHFCSRSSHKVQAGEFANCDDAWETIQTAFPVKEAFTAAGLQMMAEARAAVKAGVYDMIWKCGFIGIIGVCMVFATTSCCQAAYRVYSQRAERWREETAYSDAAKHRMKTSLPVIVDYGEKYD